MKKGFPFFLIAIGALCALFFLLADFLGLGKAGIQAAQILGVEAGALLILAGLVWRILGARGDFSPLDKISSFFAPTAVWAFAGALPAFVFYLLAPMFFHESHRIQYPAEYIRQIVPIGIDFQSMMGAIELWLKNGGYGQYMFAPLVNILFAPLLLLKYPFSYYALTLLTLAAYLMLFLLAARISGGLREPMAVFIFAVSLFSYGLVFEFERGQTYTISLMFALLAVYLFHYQRDLRWLAYLSFCVSVQMKFSPALFVLLFVDDWRDWKTNLLRFSALGAANFLLFFLFGFSYVSAFYQHLAGGMEMGEPSVVNHSIQSFTFMLSSAEWGVLRGEAAEWAARRAGLISTALSLYYFICFGAILADAWLKRRSGFNPDLFLVCLLGGLLLPSVNHDYTLSMLPAPVAMSFAAWDAAGSSKSKILNRLLLFAASFAYAALLIPHTFKPIYLKNSLPLLFLLLTALALQTLNRRSDWTPVISKTG
jgi:hypothetical protein